MKNAIQDALLQLFEKVASTPLKIDAANEITDKAKNATINTVKIMFIFPSIFY
jgi:hypothetical protein